ncbi:hypothetical protein HY628_01415 [Candidatus Uhrbacteria bacterium]|nr:hypothetical protein [Candidatus Uhrbacteria bacterium]
MEKRFHAFIRARGTFLPAGSVTDEVRRRLDEVFDSADAFRNNVAKLSSAAILAPIENMEGKPGTVIYVSRPGKDDDFKEIAGDFVEEGLGRVGVFPNEENPLVVVFGKKEELQKAGAKFEEGGETKEVKATGATEVGAAALEPGPAARDLPEMTEVEKKNWEQFMETLSSLVQLESGSTEVSEIQLSQLRSELLASLFLLHWEIRSIVLAEVAKQTGKEVKNFSEIKLISDWTDELENSIRSKGKKD